MYSEVVEKLGLSQNTMEMIVFFGIIIAVIGVILVLYWKYIVIGTLALGCVAVLANHKSTEKEKIVVPQVEVEKKEEVVNQKPIEPFTPLEGVVVPKSTQPPVMVQPKNEEPKDIRAEFMERCINLADYTRTQCDELWDDRVKEERELLEDTKLKGRKHGHYRKV